MSDPNFFLSRLNGEPHALAFGGQSTPWPVALADLTNDPALEATLRGHVAAANTMLAPVAADLLATTGRAVDLFGFKPNPARLGAAAAATVSVEGIALTQLGALIDAAGLGLDVANTAPVAVLGHSQGVLGAHMVNVIRKAGSIEGFRYSANLRELAEGGLEWTPERLRAYIQNPKSVVPRGSMTFAGIRNETQINDLMAYLATLK